MNRRQFTQSAAASIIHSKILPLQALATPNSTFGMSGETQAAHSSKSAIWMNTEPVRVGWLQLSEKDAGTDPEALVAKAAKMNLNCLIVSTAGIFAFYPTQVPFHPVSSFLPPGKDFFGDLCKAAKKAQIRIGARVDFSRTPKSALDVHPEWFFRHADGTPLIFDNDRAYPCLNTDWYHVHAMEILTELLNKYSPEVIFVNNFSNRFGNGVCYCKTCAAQYRRSRPLFFSQSKSFSNRSSCGHTRRKDLVYASSFTDVRGYCA